MEAINMLIRLSLKIKEILMPEKFRALRLSLKRGKRGKKKFFCRYRYPEYQEESLQILDQYMKEYKVELNFYQEVDAQYWVRHWLHSKKRWKAMGGQVSKYLENWYIKYKLRIVSHDKKYMDVVRTILYPKPGVNRTHHLSYFLHEGSDSKQ